MSEPLNLSSVLHSLKLVGSTFHSVAAALLNDLVAKVLHLMSGTLSFSPDLFDCILPLFGSSGLSRSMMYFGTLFCMALYAIVSTL